MNKQYFKRDAPIFHIVKLLGVFCLFVCLDSSEQHFGYME